jgi:hypothetical protein
MAKNYYHISKNDLGKFVVLEPKIPGSDLLLEGKEKWGKCRTCLFWNSDDRRKPGKCSNKKSDLFGRLLF